MVTNKSRRKLCLMGSMLIISKFTTVNHLYLFDFLEIFVLNCPMKFSLLVCFMFFCYWKIWNKIVAGKLFPYTDFFKWMSYGNGKPLILGNKNKILPPEEDKYCHICNFSCYIYVLEDGKHPGSDRSYFGRREFSFTLDNDIYLRFQSFNSLSEMENSIKEKCPFKIDIGSVYSVDVSKILPCSYHESDIVLSPINIVWFFWD